MGLVPDQLRRVIDKLGVSVVPEGFQDTRTQIVVDVVILVVYILLVLLLGKYLWNTVLCKAVTVVRPLPNVWHFLGLVVLLALL